MPSQYDYALNAHDVQCHKVKVADLNIDLEVQRTANKQRIDKIAAKFVPEAVGTLVVSERKIPVGTLAPAGRRQLVKRKLYVVDGQHRLEVLKLLGIEEVWAEVHYGLTQEDEAVLFMIRNRETQAPNAVDEYRIALKGEVKLFVDTDKVIRDHGLSMGTSSTNVIGAVRGVVKIVDQHGPDVLSRCLDIAEASWGRTAESWDGMILGGLSMFVARYGDVADEAELVRKLRVKTAAHWKREINDKAKSDAGGSGTGSRNYAALNLIKEAYNLRRRAGRLN